MTREVRTPQPVLPPVGFDPAALSAAGYELVPAGWYVHSSCIHIIPSGASVQADGLTVALNGAVYATYAPCAYPPVGASMPLSPQVSSKKPQDRISRPDFTNTLPDGGPCFTDDTIAGTPYAQYNSQYDGNGFETLQVQMFVPESPSVDNGTLYYWPGLQWNVDPPETYNGIAQPVIIYGASPAGGTAGNWYIATFYAPPSSTNSASNFYISTLVSVSQYDEIYSSTSMLNPEVSNVLGIVIEDNSQDGDPYTEQADTPGSIYVFPTAWPDVFEVGTVPPNGGVCACNNASDAVLFYDINMWEFQTGDYVTFDTGSYAGPIANTLPGCSWADLEGYQSNSGWYAYFGP